MQPEPSLDVIGIGNAIVDVIAHADDELVAREGVPRGSMRLLDGEGARRLEALMPAPRYVCGGSAANTMVGLAALGGRAAFLGKIGADEIGQLVRDDLAAAGVVDRTVRAEGGVATARCLILVTPDAQRTMSTYPGAAHQLCPADVAAAGVEDAAILYLEGYLWDSTSARAAMEAAMAAAHAAGRKVALTPSDVACIRRSRQPFEALLRAGTLDMLFLNEAELAVLAGTDDDERAAAAVAGQVPLLVVTKGEAGAAAYADGRRVVVPAAPVPHLVDTTGAGDLFAAGFLHALQQGAAPKECLGFGNAAAAEILGHLGARPGPGFRQRLGLYRDAARAQSEAAQG